MDYTTLYNYILVICVLFVYICLFLLLSLKKFL